MRSLRSFVARHRRARLAIPADLRVCVHTPRERGVLREDGSCYLCTGFPSPSLDELRRGEPRPIRVLR